MKDKWRIVVALFGSHLAIAITVAFLYQTGRIVPVRCRDGEDEYLLNRSLWGDRTWSRYNLDLSGDSRSLLFNVSPAGTPGGVPMPPLLNVTFDGQNQLWLLHYNLDETHYQRFHDNGVVFTYVKCTDGFGERRFTVSLDTGEVLVKDLAQKCHVGKQQHALSGSNSCCRE